MSSSIVVHDMDESCLAMQSYSRKEKSLGVLVSNFLRLYNRDDVDLIGLDDAAGQLGVERRRIYDVVNILESIGVVARKGKNQYLWNGFEEVPRTLNELKEEGMRERFGISSNSDKVSNDDEREEFFSLTPEDQENSASSKLGLDHKKEKSLWLLSQNFVKMFLCSGGELITLDSAAKDLLSDSQDPMHMRTKVRRLYDIANVLSSMNLIEKTQIPVTKKPAYKWLGSKDLIEKGSSLFVPFSPKKRVFGTEITNFKSKRSKTADSSSSKYRKQFESYYKEKENRAEQSKPVANSYVFGPFSPTTESKKKNNNVGNNETIRFRDIETLASTYKPQYCNQGLTGLLGHYTEAWKQWYTEFHRK